MYSNVHVKYSVGGSLDAILVPSAFSVSADKTSQLPSITDIDFGILPHVRFNAT